jgi:hypothetical protein
VSQLATASELASFLKQDVDTSTANLALTVASGLFEKLSGTKFASTAATYQVEGRGQPVINIPNSPLIAIVQVRIAGAVIASTEYTQVLNNLYRTIGWGRVLGPTLATAPYMAFPPELVEVDHTYGYTGTVPDDVKGAVLESAGAMYSSPDLTVASESIDDYSLTTSRTAGGVQLSPAASLLAEYYRIGGFA